MIYMWVILWAFSVIVAFFVGSYVTARRMPKMLSKLDDDQLNVLANKVAATREDR